jgi:hypothetical protein
MQAIANFPIEIIEARVFDAFINVCHLFNLFYIKLIFNQIIFLNCSLKSIF